MNDASRLSTCMLRVTAVVDIYVDGKWFSFVNIIELPRHSRHRGR